MFDYVVIMAAFAPGLRENATLLRLVRLLRIVRIVSVLPDVRVLIRGMVPIRMLITRKPAIST